MGPRLDFKYPVSDTSHALANQIRDAVPSPDGRKLAFTSLNRLYIMDYPNGVPKRLTTHEFTEAQPAWSPDGSSLVFSSWTPEGGNLYKVNVAGKPVVQKITRETAFYTSPVYTWKGDRIVFVRGKLRSYKESIGPVANSVENQLCWIPSGGGEISVIDKTNFRANPHFVKGEDRIYLNQNGNLISIRWDGTDEKVHARITGVTTYGMSNFKDDEHLHELNARDCCLLTEKASEAMELQLPTAANKITLAPDGSRAMAQVNNEIYIVTIPKTGKVATISVADPNNSNFPAKKLTEIGGEFANWEADSKKVHWSIGNGHFVYNIDRAQAFDDSMRLAKKAEDKRKADSIAKKATDTLKAKPADTVKAIASRIPTM